MHEYILDHLVGKDAINLYGFLVTNFLGATDGFGFGFCCCTVRLLIY